MGGDWATFFDPAKARGPAAPAGAPPGPAGEEPWTVSALVGRVKSALAKAFPKRIAVVGEISNFKRHGSGHLYFRLKDASSAVDAVMFRGRADRLRFEPEDGLEVVATGRVDVYEVRGQFQVYVETMTPRGAGALELAFRRLCEKLRGEGLFDAAHKKPLPEFPRAVGVVTSPTGAAIRDIRRTLSRRWPSAAVYVVPSLVQGEGAAEQIADALRRLDANAARLGIDTIVLARGGGSIEDLWAFNQEAVARAIFAARTPIVAGIGHEVDVTVADMVADVRAATPTAAAELAVPDADQVRQRLAQTLAVLRRHAAERFDAARAGLHAVLRTAVLRDPSAAVRTQTQRVDELALRLTGALRARLTAAERRLQPAESRLAGLHPARLHDWAAATVERAAMRLRWALGARSKCAGDRLASLREAFLAASPVHRLRLAQQRVAASARQLDAMSHRSVLRRGFSLTRGPNGAIVASAAGVAVGDRLETEFADGRVASRVVADGPDGEQGSQRERRHRAGRRGGRGEGEPTLFDADGE